LGPVAETPPPNTPWDNIDNILLLRELLKPPRDCSPAANLLLAGAGLLLSLPPDSMLDLMEALSNLSAFAAAAAALSAAAAALAFATAAALALVLGPHLGMETGSIVSVLRVLSESDLLRFEQPEEASLPSSISTGRSS
jgi:hypothetical protein